MIFHTFITLAFLSLISPSAKHVTAQPAGWCPVSTNQGYACQEYNVTTDDGYILSIQRILGGQAGPGRNGSQPWQPVLLQHGVTVDGMTWMFNAPGQSLAFVLADNGYDVWISNIRGTKYSQGHTTLSVTDPRYWDWSWEDLAEHDMTAVIGLVFKETGQKMHYVGHSMGTTIALVLLSEGKFQNVKSAALLCPIAHMAHVGTNALTHVFELDVLVSPTASSNYLKNYPQPSSAKTITHYTQTIASGRFAKFDYGLGNMAKYGAIVPPEYNLAGIAKDFPIFIAAGGQDYLSVTADVATLVNDDFRTHNPDKLQVVNLQQYSHSDFIMANNATELVYTPTLQFFQKHN